MKKNKKLISIILTSLMIFSIVLSCFSTTFVSFASDGSDLSGQSLVDKYGLTIDDILNYSDYESSDLYDENNYLPINGHYSSYDFSSYIDSEHTSLAEWGTVNYDTSCFALFKLGYVRYTVFPKDSFFACNSTENALYVPMDSLSFSSDLKYITSFPNGTYDWFTSLSSLGVGSANVDGKDYYVYFLDSSIEIIGATNAAIYSTSNPYTLTTLDGLSQGNYSDLYNSLNPSKVVQHESLRDGSGIYLDNSTCNNGTVYVVVNSDNTQTSANGYKIRYWVDCSYVIKLPTGQVTGSTNANMASVLRGYGYSATSGSITTVNGSYYWNDKPYQEIGLSELSANGGIWTETLSATNNYLLCNGKRISNLAETVSNGSTWTQNAVDGMVTLGTNLFTGGGKGFSMNNNKMAAMLTDEYTVQNVTYTFHMALYKNDVSCGEITQPYVLASSVGNTGRGDTVDTLTGSDEEYFQVGTSGQAEGSYNTDYAPSNDIRVSNGGSGGSSSSDNNSSNSTTGGNASIGDGAIVINNNPTFNNSSTASADSSSSGFGGFLSTLISLVANGKTSSVETISSISGTTGYTNLVNTYLSTVPTSLWNVIIVTMTAVLGISTIGFIVGLLFKIFF